jgi:hypothetical protein
MRRITVPVGAWLAFVLTGLLVAYPASGAIAVDTKASGNQGTAKTTVRPTSVPVPALAPLSWKLARTQRKLPPWP